ncbi:MAG: hypothetical protein K2Z81_16600 [Cyanobacteria bacterium]|nr:hypothetical protein [Cyanobacteriota bacterium]
MRIQILHPGSKTANRRHRVDAEFFANPGLFVGACLVTLLTLVTSLRADAADNPANWELTQVSKLTGSHRILITPKAFKIISPANHYVIVSKAPDWNVVAFNPRSKMMFETTLANFDGRLAYGSNTFGNYLEHLPVLSGQKSADSVFGQQCRKVHMINHGQDTKRSKTGKVYKAMMFETSDLQVVDYWSWSHSSVPPAVGKILYKIYRLPVQPGMPLRLVALNFEREKRVELDTKTFKKVTITDDAFVVPQGMRKAKSEIEMINDPRRQQALKNLIQNWDQWGRIVDHR